MLPTPRRLDPPDVSGPFPYPPHDTDPSSNTDDEHELRRRRSVNNDLMIGLGDGVVDDMFDVDPVPLSSVSCVLHPDRDGRAYFFCGNRYAIIKINPGTTDDTLDQGPFNIVSYWPSLSQAQFAGGVDAVLPSPEIAGDLYFFSNRKYALIRSKSGTTNDYIITGPNDISTGWPSLHKSGFDVVDAVLPNPANDHKVYFFSGTQYVHCYQPSTTDGYIISGPTDIWSDWPSLKQAGFRTVDAILPHPENSEAAYFFSGSQYALIHIAPGSTDDYIINGPKLVRTGWPSLHQAGFW